MSTTKQYGLTGISSSVEFGKGGSRIKESSGIIEARNNADGAYVIVRGLDPVGDSDLVTKQYLTTGASGGIVSVTGQIDGTAPPAVVPGAIYIVTKTGGSYTLNELWYGGSVAWIKITSAYRTMYVTTALTGNTREYAANAIYVYDGADWWRATNYYSVHDIVKFSFTNLTNASVGTNTFGINIPVGGPGNIPASAYILRASVKVVTVFDGSSTLSIGDSVDGVSAYMATSEIDLTTQGTYISQLQDGPTASARLFTATLAGTPTQGLCRVAMQWGYYLSGY